MLDGEKLKKKKKKNLFVTIMKGKILAFFTTLHYMIDGEESYFTHLINLFIFKCN